MTITLRPLVPSLALALALPLAAGCAGTSAAPPAADPPAAAAAVAPSAEREAVVFLQPNVEVDGKPAYVHVTPRDMPWRVAVGRPRHSPRYGSRRDAREAAIEAMRMWEAALRETVPWFRLEFVEEDPDAPVQVTWLRRMVGDAAGRGGFRCEERPEGFRMAGEITISVRPDPLHPPLTVDEVRLLVAHEFGHVLGLGHCLDCDSAMNYAWHTRERILVTASDVETFAALLAERDACSGMAAAVRGEPTEPQAGGAEGTTETATDL